MESQEEFFRVCDANHRRVSGRLQLHYLRLPKDISEDHVILMDCTVSTGAAAMMAVRVLLVSEQRTVDCSAVASAVSPARPLKVHVFLCRTTTSRRTRSCWCRC